MAAVWNRCGCVVISQRSPNRHQTALFALASADNLLIVWNVAEKKAVARLDNTKGVPVSVSWCWNSADGVAFVSQRGPLYIWVYRGPDPGVTVHKEAHSFLSDICLFRWYPTKKGKLVFGHTDGSLSVFQPDQYGLGVCGRLEVCDLTTSVIPCDVQQLSERLHVSVRTGS